MTELKFRKLSPEDEVPIETSVTLPTHIVRAFEQMEKNTKIPKDTLVTKALMMFIATHNDYLGLRT